MDERSYVLLLAEEVTGITGKGKRRKTYMFSGEMVTGPLLIGIFILAIVVLLLLIIKFKLNAFCCAVDHRIWHRCAGEYAAG